MEIDHSSMLGKDPTWMTRIENKKYINQTKGPVCMTMSPPVFNAIACSSEPPSVSRQRDQPCTCTQKKKVKIKRQKKKKNKDSKSKGYLTFVNEVVERGCIAY